MQEAYSCCIYRSYLPRPVLTDLHLRPRTALQQKGNLLSSWEFPYKDRVPRPGDERVHFNLWQANWGGVPRRNRRVHVVINGMEHSPPWIDLPAAGIYPAAGRLLAWTRSLAGESAAPVETEERMKPTPRPKAEPPAGAAKGAAAPAGVDAELAKYPQVSTARFCTHSTMYYMCSVRETERCDLPPPFSMPFPSLRMCVHAGVGRL